MSGAAAVPGEWTVPASLDRAVSDRNQSIWLYIGRLQESFNDNDRALHAYENVLKHNRSNVDAIVSAGLLLMKKEHLPDAMTYLTAAVQLEPTNGKAWRALAYSHIMNEDMEKAYHAYSNALANLQDHHDPNLWFGVGIVYDRIGRLDDALRAFDAVLSLNPAFERSDEVYYSIGLIYKEQGNYTMANSYMAKIISINFSHGAHAEAWYQIGTLHDLAGSANSATEAYQAALARNPAHTKCIQALAWLVHKSGNSNKAVELLQRAMNFDESDGTTYYLTGRIYMANNEFRVAYDNYQRAVHLDGKNANFWCSIASLYYQRQQYRDAMDAYSRAVHINPEIAEIWYDLGILYEAYNQNDDAMDSYRRASDLQPQNPRFTQRMSALRNAMANGTSLTKPTERPLTDGPDMSPTTRSGQRPHLKCDVVQRYGLLPAPPVVQAPVQQTAAMPTNQMAPIPASRAVSDDRHLRSGMPAIATRTAAVVENGMHPSSAVANVSNGIVTHSSSVMQKQQHVPVSSHSQRVSPMVPNGSGETMHPPAGKDMRFMGGSPTPAGVVASAAYPSQMAIAPQQDIRGDSRAADYSRAPVSPTFRGTLSQPIEQRSQQPFSQGHPSSEGMRSMPQQYSQPLHSSSGPRNVQDAQSSPANGMTGREYSQRDESRWPTASDRMSADSRAFPTSRPEMSAGYPRTEAAVDRPTPGSSMTQAGAFSSMPNQSAPVDHTRTEQTGSVGATRPLQAPLPPFTTTHSHFANETQARYPEGPQSNSAAYPARGTEASSFPDGRDRDGMVGSLSHAPRPSVSDEPSRRSVSSSHEKSGHGPFRSREMAHDASNHVPASSPIIVRSQALSNGERVGLRDDASQPHIEHREAASRLQSTAHLLNPIRESQLGSKATVEKADSPVDEEMLPRLPPLPPPTQDEQSRLPGVDFKARAADGHDSKSPLASRPENMAESSARQGNAPNGAEPKGVKEEGLGPHGPMALSVQDTRHHGPTENDVAARGNGFSRNHDNPSGSQSDMYGGRSVSPAVKRVSEGMPINGTSRPMPQGQMLSQPNENGIIGNAGNGHRTSHLPTMGKSPEVRSTTAVTATEESAQRQPQDGKERQLRTVSPLPSSSPEQSSSLHRPASNRQSPEHGSASRHSSGQLGFAGGDGRGGKQSESYDYAPARDKMQKSPQPPRVPSTGIRSSLQLENSGGLPTLKKPRLQSVDSENERGERIPTQSQPDARNGGGHMSSLRNPFGSGMSASFSKSLSRSGPSGPIGVVSVKEPGASETTARTANSEGLTLKTPVERKDGHAMRDSPHEEISGLGKRNASTYENGNLRAGETTEYGRFMPKPAVIGPSIENKVRSPDAPQQQPRFSGGMPSYRPGLEGRNFGDGNAELNRPKAHHHTGADSNANRFNGGDL